MKGIYKRIFVYIRPSFYVFLLALLCMFINALATGLYAYLIGPVVKFLFTGGLEKGDSLSQAIEFIGLSPAHTDKTYLLILLPVLIIVSSAIKGASQYGRFYLMGVLGEKAVFSLRLELIDKLNRISLKNFEDGKAGDFITKVVSDTNLVAESITNALSSLFTDSLKIIVLLSVAVILDWQLALITFLVLPILAIPISKLGKRLRKTSNEVQNSRSEMTSQVEEDIRQARVIRDFDIASQRSQSFEIINKNYLQASFKSFSVRALASPVMEIIGAFGLCATIGYAGYRMQTGSLVPEHFVSFFAAILMLYEPQKNLGRLNAIIQSGRIGGQRAFQLLDLPDENSDDGTQFHDEIRGQIRLENVVYKYGKRRVIDGLNLVLDRNETVALVGESGAGKTTISRLLLRHFTPESGEIFIDDKNINDIKLQSLRKLISVVEQRPLLFDISILDNVRLGKPEQNEAEILQACEKASLLPLFERLSNGWHTKIGERGARLSEGEKQRISLARAFLKKAPLLILDEVTSSLDKANEEIIIESIKNLPESTTVLIISHRKSILSVADRVVELKNGKIYPVNNLT